MNKQDIPLKLLFLEPFYGGSHKNFADGLVSHSTHDIDLYTLPSRFWKWRMRGAALYFLRKVRSMKTYDGLITTDLMSVSDLKALSAEPNLPILVYFHENQLSYPLEPGESIDYQFGFTDITTALAADRILFNSHTHLNSFLSTLPRFLDMMPEFRPKWAIDAIRKKSGMLYPGCKFSKTAKPKKERLNNDLPPLIIWNHRWEFDKNPDDFFAALEKISNRGIEFRLALLGENFQKRPKAFITARERFKNNIVQYGYVESRKEYYRWLENGSIIISTANQENFGMSVVEAVRYGCIPLLPDRLSYPEIIPKTFHRDFLYSNQEDLVEKLSILITRFSEFQEKREKISRSMDQYSWENLIQEYDKEFEKLFRR